MPITALYAALLAPLFILLSVRIIRLRRGAKVSLGDGGNADLLQRMRMHANFAEYAPFALLLMALAESLHAWSWALHLLGMALLFGRLSHAYGMAQPRALSGFRVMGMAATFTVIAAAAVVNIVLALQHASTN
jgi:uncharacterized protein